MATTPPGGPGGLERLLVERYGTSRGGRPNTRAAAADLGVAQRQVQRWLKAEREGRPVTHSHAAARLTSTSTTPAAPRGPQTPAGGPAAPTTRSRPSGPAGGPAAAPGKPPTASQQAAGAMATAAQSAGDIRDLESELRSRYGTGPRGGINVKAAGADLGVAPSTVRSWIRNARQGRPVPQRSDAVNALRRHAGEDRMRQRGATMRLTGTIRISADARKRSIEYAFTGDEMSHYLELRDAGDPQALEDWLSDVYIGGDTLVDDLEFLEFDPLP